MARLKKTAYCNIPFSEVGRAKLGQPKQSLSWVLPRVEIASSPPHLCIGVGVLAMTGLYMILKYTFKTAIRALRANKSRSGLTILGIVIGITAVILVTSVGQGAENLILDQIRTMGAETISIEPGREPRSASEFAEIFTDSLKDREVAALQKPANVPGIKKVSPMVMLTATLSFEAETKRASIIGGDEFIAKIFELHPAEGVFFTEEEIKQRAAVVVLGIKVKEKLFGASDAVGQNIKIKNKTFRVIGVIPPKGTVSMYDIDNMVTVPYTTAQKYLLGINHYHAILVQAQSEKIVPQVVQDIKTTLREMHNITDPEKDDFHVTTQADAIERVGQITTILSVLLGSIAAISLVVGGIGIMNIMLVSVTERTQEIGLRKALGATNRNILWQFLCEAIILTVIGGIVGVSLGAGFSLATSVILSRTVISGWSFTFPLESALLGLAVAASVGLIFGLYPARQAAKKNPIEALRYE